MSQQYDWLVQIPDKANALEHRMSHLSAHLTYNKSYIEAGKLVMTGPTLSSQPESANEVPAMTGSVLLLKAGDEDEVWQIVRGNPYAKLGVWDMEKVTVTPFRCVVRVGM